MISHMQDLRSTNSATAAHLIGLVRLVAQLISAKPEQCMDAKGESSRVIVYSNRFAYIPSKNKNKNIPNNIRIHVPMNVCMLFMCQT